MKNQILFLPGPQKNQISESHKLNIFHRSSSAMKTNEQLKNQLSSFFQAEESLIIPFSASETIDLFCRSLSSENKNVSVIDSGYWAQYLIQILAKNDFQVRVYEKDILELPQEKITELLRNDQSLIFFALAMETATGEIFDYSEFYAQLKQANKFLFLDAVSYPYFYDLESSFLRNCDFGLLASAKNFLSAPGFSFLLFKEAIKNYPFFVDQGYTNIFLFKNFLDLNQLPHTYNGRGLENIWENFLFITQNQTIILEKINQLRELFFQRINLDLFSVVNQKKLEQNNLVVLKINNPQVHASVIIDFLSDHNLYVGGDLMQQNTIRICFTYLNTIQEVKKLVQLLNNFQHNQSLLLSSTKKYQLA